MIFPKNEAGDRYSLAYFCHPLDDALLEPVPSAIVQKYMQQTGKSGSRDGKALTAKDHLMERLNATYTIKPSSEIRRDSPMPNEGEVMEDIKEEVMSA